MSWIHVVSGLIALALLVYLFMALLKPELFE
jgi:K+-transporting ATPase KdpF subunit